MRNITLILLTCLLICTGCNDSNEGESIPVAPLSDFADLTISLGDQAMTESHCIIELDVKSSRYKGTRSFSSSNDREFLTHVSYCYVGDSELSDIGNIDTKNKIIAVLITKVEPTSSKVMFSRTFYCRYKNQKQIIFDEGGLQITLSKHHVNK